MSLTLHYHPLSSYCHKVLLALYELGLPFDAKLVNPGDAAERAAFMALWPTGKIPLLVDAGRVVAETSIIIEHLDRGQARLLPADADACLTVRLWDRLFDLYVMTPVQAIVGDRLRAEGERDPVGVANARRMLAMAYDLIESRMAATPWAAGASFSLADCAAAPSLFYASTLAPFPAGHTKLAAYFERLLQRPSVARVLDEARPFFQYYPYREALPARFL
jgi:glutathione S-transferase